MKGGNTTPHITNCTFIRNSSPAGGAMYIIAGASPLICNCILAFSQEGSAMYVRDNTCKPYFSCTIIWQNNGGDWTEDIVDQLGIDGNLNIDPKYCDAAEFDFSLREDSPCLPENNSCEEPIGATSTLCGL